MAEQNNGPLTGLRVVEFQGIGPGPHVGMMLADMGAEIVRIEREGYRPMNPVVERARHRIAVDLKSVEGIAAVKQALVSADVLLEGFRPGVMERLGLGPKEMLAANPRLVYARITGWGQEGPLAQAAGHDLNYIAITGALDAVGRKGELPVPPQNLVGDFGGGSMYCAMGILAALYERERSGRGQVVDAAMVDGVTSLMSFFFGQPESALRSTKRGHGLLGGAAHFYRCYACKDGKEISVGAIEPQFYTELLERADAPEELREGQMNPANWDDYSERLAALFATKTLGEWCEILEGTDACFAPVVPLDEVREHPHMKARGAYVEKDGRWHTAPAPRFDRTPATIRESAEDGAEVVARWSQDS
ncbi:CaiB/BaiF CoA transferase family protein [Qipengyuania spongiae]|uniref:CoA transferase n=1 Tax=Qipengyuania spongiae TaxID=2909673 RepID=A0ABY5SYM3_9SPHN|nr:CaiB/BaiF CoA-transferase family protein [Qipengyuania spongiae]UVI39430.1 CoA transferase [Qipengyuania spongiae]